MHNHPNENSSVTNADGTTSESSVTNADGTTTTTGSGYCTDLGDGKTIATTSYFVNRPTSTSTQCTGDYTLAVKNEFQCNKIKDQVGCGSNKTCTWNSTNNACKNDNWNKWFCSKPKNKCGEKWSSAPGFFFNIN